jgi:hypothetical protein
MSDGAPFGTVLDELALPARGQVPDWHDVLERAGHAPVRSAAPRRARRWFVAALAAGLLAVLIVAPALGLHREVIDFLSAEPAPEPVKLEFAQLDAGAPKGMESDVIAGQTRRVMETTVDGKRHVLWVAPTPKGGFCLTWSEHSGGCVTEPALLTSDLGVTWAATTRGGGQTLTKVDGWVLDGDIAAVELAYEDGARQTVRLVWVSEPIDAAFFFAAVPREHRRPGHELVAVVARDADGNEVAREDAPPMG